MRRTEARKPHHFLLLTLLTAGLVACASGTAGEAGRPPATRGTHTVMGRGFFPGGVMVLVEAHLNDGAASGFLQYSRVESRRENTFRVEANVECVGLFADGSEAVVAGPVTRVDGDVRGIVSARDWWVLQIAEGGADGDLILSERHPETRALSLCQSGPTGSALLRAVDGDLSIH